ncbi:MAG: DUF5674 family protein [bacterium]|nr:DUF5674 family protein [bacterium]
MIITTDKPYTKHEIANLQEVFGSYIKTVIDLDKKICTAGMDRHFEGEAILLDQGSKQADIWGGGIDTVNKTIDCNSFINIRPNDNNESNDILDSKLRKQYQELTKQFFQAIYD